jgi:polysaccharide export outer membrane protein
MKIGKSYTTGVAILIFILASASSTVGQAYRIGPEDQLEVNFWQDPGLNSLVRVSLDGKITLDIIGQIDAAAKTTEELQNDIVRMISRLNQNISQAVVRVTEYNFNHIYVTGEVNSPGKLAFEAIPDLWSIINEAGGITDQADLTRVTIIRGGDEAGVVEIANVSSAISNGTLDRLPKVRRQDTVELPRSLMGLPSSDLGRATEMRNVIYVVGAVTQPGAITFEENIDVMEAIALAGGPSANAELDKTKIITKDGYYAQSLQVNLEKYSMTGKPFRYKLRKEDTILIPERRTGGIGANITTIVGVLGAVTSAILIYERLNSDDN